MNESDTFRVPPDMSDTTRIVPKRTVEPRGPEPAAPEPPPAPEPEPRPDSAPPPPPPPPQADSSALPPPPPPGATPGQTSSSGRHSVLRGFWNGCLVASFGVVAFSALAMVLAAWSCSRAVSNVGSAASAASASSLSAHDDDGFKLSDVAELNLARKGKGPATGAPRVLHVVVNGVIASDPGDRPLWKPDAGSIDAAVRDIRRATLDPRIDGIFLQIDSPGGEVTASDVAWKALKDFRASRQDTATPRFVVAMMGSVAASGAYYVCAAADCIVAHPTTLTGSIGVKMSSINVRGLADRYGVKEVSIVSGPNKNMLSPFQDLTEPQRQMLQAQVDALQKRFVELVAKGRRMDEARVREVADGRILLAEEALKAGLVDEIGYVDDAKAQVSKLLGGATPRYVSYSRGDTLLRSIFSPEFFGSAIREAFPSAGSPANAGPTMEAEGL